MKKMIFPVIAYGHPVLKKKAVDVPQDYQDLDILMDNMWNTMYNAQGVGLAAPQIGKSLRIFIIDTLQIDEEGKEAKGLKQVFINAEMLEESGKQWTYEEGCLSIPHIRGDVERLNAITIKYLDADFVEHTQSFEGVNARVIQHEYDHIEGKLFTEKLKPLKKRLIQRKLEAIRKGNVKADYRMKFI